MRNQEPILDEQPDEEGKPNTHSFLKGALYVIAYYAAGCFAAWVAYSIVGYSYGHAPGLHHLIILFTLLGALGWTIVAGLKTIIGKASKKTKGSVLTNTLVFGFILFLYINEESESEPVQPQSTDEIHTVQKGDTAILYYNDNIIYMKVGDSLLLNAIDSANMPFDLE